jgi:hypothetical protein
MDTKGNAFLRIVTSVQARPVVDNASASAWLTDPLQTSSRIQQIISLRQVSAGLALSCLFPEMGI